MNPIRSSALLIAGLACLFTGCRSGKVLREDFSELQRIEIPEAGISFLFLPGKIDPEDRQKNLVFALVNPVDEYPDLGQDARFMMKLLFTKDDSPPYEPLQLDELWGGHGLGDPWADFRKIIQCTSGLYWHLGISVGRYSIDGHEYFEEDIEIARRILESVECIPIESTSDGTAAP